MSARAIQRLSLFTQRLPQMYLCSSRQVGSEGKGGGRPPKASKTAPPTKTVTPSSSPSSSPPPPVSAAAPSQEKFDNSQYQAQQLFGYNPMSFYDIELDMASARLPQPSSLKKTS